jgi:hypothetical protein
MPNAAVFWGDFRWRTGRRNDQDAREGCRLLEAPMTEHATVRLDEGGVNRRILARQAVADYRRVEQATIKQRTNLRSPEGKRLFARFFHSLQLNVYFVSEIARMHLSGEDVEKVEQILRKRLDGLMAEMNEGIDGAHALFTANGITGSLEYEPFAWNGPEIALGNTRSFVPDLLRCRPDSMPRWPRGTGWRCVNPPLPQTLHRASSESPAKRR